MTTTLSHVHRFVAATDTSRLPLLLLHGTGGNETDLLPLGRALSPGAALLSPRGQVLENGMPRFFRRLAEGVFDEEDVRRRANDLADFVEEARAIHKLPAPIAVGFSNGANIAAALLLLRPEVVSGAVLIRAMIPFRESPVADLTGKPVLILSGAMDPIVPAENAGFLASVLRKSGAAVEHRTLLAGHSLGEVDVSLAQKWLANIGKQTV